MLAARHLRGITLIPPGREAGPVGGASGAGAAGGTGVDRDAGPVGHPHAGRARGAAGVGLHRALWRAGERLLRLARGETRRSLRAMAPPESYQRRVELEHPQRLLEPLLFVISSLLNELMQGLSFNRVTLGLNEVPRTLEFPVPVRESKVVLKQLQFDLEAHSPQAAIVSVEVQLNPVEARVLQHGLFIPQAPAPEKLHLTLARLTGLLGKDNVGSPELLDTHRPDAFVMRAFSAEAAAGGERAGGDSICVSILPASPGREGAGEGGAAGFGECGTSSHCGGAVAGFGRLVDGGAVGSRGVGCGVE